jgi:hypothetical protein
MRDQVSVCVVTGEDAEPCPRSARGETRMSSIAGQLWVTGSYTLRRLYQLSGGRVAVSGTLV